MSAASWQLHGQSGRQSIYGVIHAISCISSCTDCNEWIGSKFAIIGLLAMTSNPISHGRNFTHPPHESPIYAFFPTRFFV